MVWETSAASRMGSGRSSIDRWPYVARVTAGALQAPWRTEQREHVPLQVPDPEQESARPEAGNLHHRLTVIDERVPAPVGGVLPEMGRDQHDRPVRAAAHVRQFHRQPDAARPVSPCLPRRHPRVQAFRERLSGGVMSQCIIGTPSQFHVFLEDLHFASC